MSYSIDLSTYQANPSLPVFSIVEQTVWNYADGGTWSTANDTNTLTMGGSGTSGTIRFKFMSTGGELFLVALGVDNYAPWCDIVASLQTNETGVVINPEYYNNGPRASMRTQHMTDYNVTSLFDTNVEVKYTATSGNSLAADVEEMKDYGLSIVY